MHLKHKLVQELCKTYILQKLTAEPLLPGYKGISLTFESFKPEVLVCKSLVVSTQCHVVHGILTVNNNHLTLGTACEQKRGQTSENSHILYTRITI